MRTYHRLARLLLVFTAAGSLAACEDGPSPPPLPSDSGVDIGIVTDVDPRFCSSDMLCDDGIFCNGREYCAPNARGADERGCVPARDPPCNKSVGCTESGGGHCDPTCPDNDDDGQADRACGGTDCDDNNRAVHPGAQEACDSMGVDEDCDPCTVSPMDGKGGDRDLDSYASRSCVNRFREGAPTCSNSVVVLLDSVDGGVAGGGRVVGADCNDDPAMSGSREHPFQPEVCLNNRDDDCDGNVDNTAVFYRDLDNDGRGDPGARVPGAMCGPGLVANADDCDDLRSETYRGAPEQCDGLDNNCSLPGAMAGGPDRTEDVDGDRHSPPSATCLGRGEAGALSDAFRRDDCDDRAALVHPDAAEICGNGVDEDCDGTADNPVQRVCDDRDRDQHGAIGSEHSVARCDLRVGEVPASRCDDCDDGVTMYASRRFPGNREICDGVDNDCSEADSRTGRASGEDEDGDGYAASNALCAGRGESGVPPAALPRRDCDDNNAAIRPGARELCGNSADDDCDGRTDVITQTVCLDRDGDGHGNPMQTSSVRGCDLLPGTVPASRCMDCNDDPGSGEQTHPDAPEICNGRDDNCDGRMDEVFACSAAVSTGFCPVCGRSGTRRCNIASCSWMPGCTIDFSSDPQLPIPVNNRTVAVLGPASYSVEFTWSYFARTVRISVVDLDAPAGSPVLATQDFGVGCPCCNGTWAGEQRSLTFTVSDAQRCHRIEFRFEIIAAGDCIYNAGAALSRITLTRTSQYTSADY